MGTLEKFYKIPHPLALANDNGGNLGSHFVGYRTGYNLLTINALLTPAGHPKCTTYGHRKMLHLNPRN